MILKTTENTASATDGERPIWEVAAALVRDIPEDALNTLPTDSAAQQDHQFYTAPRRG